MLQTIRKILKTRIDFDLTFKLLTVPIRSKLTESKPHLKPGFTFWVYSGFTKMDTKKTQSKPRVDTVGKPSQKYTSASRR